MVWVNRRNPITRQELRVRNSRVNRRDQLHFLTRRPCILFIDRDYITPEIEALLQDGETPSMRVEFAPENYDEI